MESSFTFHAWHLSIVGTYLWHSTLAIFIVWVLLAMTQLQDQDVQEWLWKLALTIGFVTAPCHLWLGSGSAVELPIEAWCHQVSSSLTSQSHNIASQQSPPFESRFRDESSLPFDQEQAASEIIPCTEFSQPFGGRAPAEKSVSSQVTRSVSLICILWYLLAIGRFGYAKFRLSRAMGKAHSIGSSPADRCLSELMERESVPGTIRILRSDRGVEPSVFGLWKPIILLPENCVSRLELPSLYALLAHEVAHIVRRDLFWTEFGFAMRCLFPFHLPFRMAFRKWQEIAEELSDDWAVERGVRPIALSQSLAKIAQLKLATTNLPIDLRPSLGMGAATSPIAQRVQRLLENKEAPSIEWNRKSFSLLILALSLATLFLFGGPRFVIAESSSGGGIASYSPSGIPKSGSSSLPTIESETSGLQLEEVIGELNQLQVNLEYATGLIAKSERDDALRLAVQSLQKRIQDLMSDVLEVENERNRK